jgi:hypothetical protein
MNIRLEDKSVRVRVTHDEVLRLKQDGILKDYWLTIRTDSPEFLILERQEERFVFRLTQNQLGYMLETGTLELEQEGDMQLSFEIDRFTF